MYLLVKTLSRFVEADVPVMSDSQQLQIHTAQRLDQFRISTAFFSESGSIPFGRCVFSTGIFTWSNRFWCINSNNSDRFPGSALIFIQVHRHNLRKVQISLAEPFHQLFIQADGSGSRSQSENTIRFHNNLCRYDICSLSAHICIIFALYILMNLSLHFAYFTTDIQHHGRCHTEFINSHLYKSCGQCRIRSQLSADADPFPCLCAPSTVICIIRRTAS